MTWQPGNPTPTYDCQLCSAPCGTNLLCDNCRPLLTSAQYDRIMRLWHFEVCRRDNWTCTYCGTDFDGDTEEGRQMVCGDHIEQKLSAPADKLNVANGRCTCLLCHNKRHQGIYSPHDTMKKNKQREAEKKTEGPPRCKKCKRWLAVPELKGLCVSCYSS